ncbi:hypothetical protein FACS189459_6960 [Bacilli bacterium]|nr:hypothetical protein FACS189459_6960 [Bacilli bacterium]
MDSKKTTNKYFYIFLITGTLSYFFYFAIPEILDNFGNPDS